MHISNVVYSNIKGTSNSEVALTFDCSDHFPCQGILLRNVNLEADHQEHEGDKRRLLKALCNNVILKKNGSISPNCS